MALQNWLSFRLTSLMALVAGVGTGIWFNTWCGKGGYEKFAGWAHHQFYIRRFHHDEVYTSTIYEPLHIPIKHSRFAFSQNSAISQPWVHTSYIGGQFADL